MTWHIYYLKRYQSAYPRPRCFDRVNIILRPLSFQAHIVKPIVYRDTLCNVIRSPSETSIRLDEVAKLKCGAVNMGCGRPSTFSERELPTPCGPADPVVFNYDNREQGLYAFCAYAYISERSASIDSLLRRGVSAALSHVMSIADKKLMAAAKAYRNALLAMSTATAAFATAMEACSRWAATFVASAELTSQTERMSLLQRTHGRSIGITIPHVEP